MPLRFSQTVFSFAPDKKPENIPDSEEIISGQQRLHTHAEGAFRPASAKDSHICREILTKQMASSVGGGFSNERTLKANCALLRPSEGLLRVTSNFRRLMQKEVPLKARKEDHLKQPARVLSGQQRPLSDQRRIFIRRRAGGAMTPTKRVLPPSICSSRKKSFQSR